MRTEQDILELALETSPPCVHRPSVSRFAPRIVFPLFLLSVAVLLAGGDTRADITISIQQVGANVVASGAGEIDLTGLTFLGTSKNTPGIVPSQGYVVMGTTPGPLQNDLYTGITGPSSFGGATGSIPTSGSGDATLLDGNFIGLPVGYVSGTSITSTDTYSNTTISAMSLTPGTYTYTWGTGGPDHTLALQIGVPEPSTALIAVFGAVAFIAYGWSRHRVRRPSVSRFAPRIVFPLFLLSVAILATRSAQADITYALQNYPADQSGHTLSGFITTDGVVGTLSTFDIKAWTVTIDNTTFSSSDPFASNGVSGDHLTATSTQILLAAGTPLDQPAELLLFSEPDGTPATADSLEYNRNFLQGQVYEAVLGNNQLQWQAIGAKMGGTDPWVIATVPEPSTALIAVFGALRLHRLRLVPPPPRTAATGSRLAIPADTETVRREPRHARTVPHQSP
jgi:hypothetical protein